MTPNTHDTTLFSIATPDVVESKSNAIVPPLQNVLPNLLFGRVVRDLIQEVR